MSLLISSTFESKRSHPKIDRLFFYKSQVPINKCGSSKNQWRISPSKSFLPLEPHDRLPSSFARKKNEAASYGPGPSISTNVLGEALVSFSAWLTALDGLPKNNKLDFNLVNPSSSIEPRYLNRIEARGWWIFMLNLFAILLLAELPFPSIISMIWSSLKMA